MCFPSANGTRAYDIDSERWVDNGLPNFRDGTGRFRKIRVPNFWDARTVTEVPTCLKYGITENLTCLNSGITENLTYLKSGIKLLKLYSSYPGSSVQCTVHTPRDCTGGEGHVKCRAAWGGAAAQCVYAQDLAEVYVRCNGENKYSPQHAISCPKSRL